MPNDDLSLAATRDYGRRTREYAGLLDRFLQRRRAWKQQRYLEKIGSTSGPRILAEGDSWFEYPYSKDLIVWLGERYPVLSLAKAGDSFREVTAVRDELFSVLRHPPQRKDFHIVLLSLGGNEVMGRMEDVVYPFDINRSEDNYIRSTYQDLLDDVKSKYSKIIDRIIDNHTQHVILHGYDYPDAREPMQPGDQPNGSQWIGPPLKHERGIDTLQTWRRIANMMIERYNTMLKGLAARPQYSGRVHFVSLLGTIGQKDHRHGPNSDMWADEIHGSDEGFAKLAEKFEPVIDQIWQRMQVASVARPSTT
jgi:metacaspase-1